jgi:hypothetical protein
MTKPTPANLPHYYGTLAKAIYENEPEAAIKEKYPDAKVLETKTIFLFWKYILVQKGDELAVAFRGIENRYLEVFPAFIAQMQEPTAVIRIMEHDIKFWEKKYQKKVSVFVGHSKGGYFATRVLKTLDIFRLTINGQKTQRGKKNINLRTKDDLLHTLMSVKGRSTCIGPGGHPIAEAVALLEGRTWIDISSKFQKTETFEPSQLTTSPIKHEAGTPNASSVFEEADSVEPSQLLTSLVGLQAATNDLADQLSQEKPLIDDVNLDKDLHDLSESCPPVTAELQKELEKNGNYYKYILAGTQQLAIEVYSFLQNTEEERFRGRQIKGSERQIQRQKEHGERSLETQDTNFSFQQLESRIAHSLNPNGIGQTIREVKEFAEQYKKDVQLLKESLQKNRKAGETLQEQLQNLDQLDANSKRYYRQVLKSQKKLSKGLRILGGVLNVTSAVLTSMSTVNPTFLVAAGAAQVGNQFIGQALNKKRSQTERRYQRTVQKHIDIRNQIYSVSSQIGFQRAHLQEQQHQLQDLLIHRDDLFDPETHIKALEESVDQLQDELGDLNRKLAEKQKALTDEKAAIAASEIAKTAQEGTLHATKKKKKPEAQRFLDGIKARLVSQQTRAVELEQEVQVLESLKQKSKETLDETQKCFDETQFVAPLKIHTWTVIVQEDARWIPADERARKLQLVMQQNFKLYSESRLTSHQVAEAAMSAAMGLANELEKITGSQRPNQAVSLISQLYQLHDLHKYWKDFAGPQLQMLKDKYSGGSWANVKETVGTATFVLQFCVPAVRTVTIGLSCIRTAKALFSSTKQCPSELEIYLQALKQTTQQFKDVLDHHFDALQSQMSRQQTELLAEIRKVHVNLGIMGDHLIREIDASKTEIMQKAHDGDYNDYMVRIKSLDEELSSKSKSVKLQLQNVRDPNDNSRLTPEDPRHIPLLLKFLAELEIDLGKTTKDINNGINLGNNTRVNTLHPYPIIDITLAYRNPDYLIGFLATRLGTCGEFPNWQLLETLTEGLVDILDYFAKGSSYVESIKTDEVVRAQLLKVCNIILHQQIELETLLGQIRGLIQRVCDHQRVLLEQMANRAQMVRLMKAHYIAQTQQAALVKFEPYSERTLSSDFVGSSKFFLHQAFVERNMPIPDWDFEKIARENASWSLRMFSLGHTFVGVAGFKAYTMGIGALVPSLSPHLKVSAVAFAILGSIMEYWSRGLAVIPQKEYKNGQEIIEYEMKSPLKRLWVAFQRGELITQRTGRIYFQNLMEVEASFPLYLDLKQRHIVCLTNPTSASQFPLLNLQVSGSAQILGIVFQNDSLIQLADLEKIPEPDFVQKDEVEYDQELKNLIQHYLSYLDYAVNDVQLVTKNRFKAIAKSSQIVPGIMDQLIPLALPRKLLESLEEQLNPDLLYLEATGIGTLIPFYDFSDEDCKLTIYYRYVLAENPSETKNYCKFTVAQFNQSTVYAFQKELKSSSGFGNPTEFLIQALYGSFETNLGLPGYGTEIISSGLIAPKEIPFVGLYQLWERFPDSMINYRSAEYTVVLHKSLWNALKDERVDSLQFSALIRPRQHPEFLGEYLNIWSTIHSMKKEIKTIENDFKTDFYLLLAMIKLLSRIDNTTLFEQLDYDLNLLPPEQQDSWANRYINQKQLSMVSKDKIEYFMEVLKAVPSHKLKLLTEHQTKVLKLKMHLMDV